jgi:transaldolase
LAKTRLILFPLETLNAYRDHGHPKQSLDQMAPEACQFLDSLSSVGVNLDTVSQQLKDEGVNKFIAAFDHLMAALKEKEPAVLEPSALKY